MTKENSEKKEEEKISKEQELMSLRELHLLKDIAYFRQHLLASRERQTLALERIAKAIEDIEFPLEEEEKGK